MVKKYELTCLLDSQLGDEGYESMVSKIEERLGAVGTEVVNVDRWGLRKLAYTSVGFRRRQQAYYVLYQFTAETGAFDEIEAELKLDESVLRHLLVSVVGEFIRVPQLAPDTVYIQTREDRGYRGRGRGRFERGEGERRPAAAARSEERSEGGEKAAEAPQAAEAAPTRDAAPVVAETAEVTASEEGKSEG